MDLIVKNCELDETSKEYCILYYTLDNNTDILINIEMDPKEYYYLLTNNVFSRYFFGNSFVKFTLAYIESLNMTNVYNLHTTLKNIADIYFPKFKEWYNGTTNNCDSECFYMFFIHDMEDDIEDVMIDRYNNYLDFMYNNYFDKFLVIKNYVEYHSFEDTQKILNDFLLKKNMDISSETDSESEHENEPIANKFILFKRDVQKIIYNCENDPSDREIINNIYELDSYNNLVLIDTDQKWNYIKCVFSRDLELNLPLYSYATHKLIVEHFDSICELIFAFDLSIDDVKKLWNNYNLLSNDKIILLGEHYLSDKYDYDAIDNTMEIYCINENNEFINLNHLKEVAITILQNSELSPIDIYTFFNEKIEYIDNKYIFELFSSDIDNENPIYYEIYSKLTNEDAKQYLIEMLTKKLI